MGLTLLFAALLAAGLVLLAVVAVWAAVGGIGDRRTITPPVGSPGTGRTPARQVLDERYARGELTTEEYRERVEVLGEES